MVAVKALCTVVSYALLVAGVLSGLCAFSVYDVSRPVLRLGLGGGCAL